MPWFCITLSINGTRKISSVLKEILEGTTFEELTQCVYFQFNLNIFAIAIQFVKLEKYFYRFIKKYYTLIWHTISLRIGTVRTILLLLEYKKHSSEKQKLIRQAETFFFKSLAIQNQP